jgi:hypothetical protein
MIIEITKEVNSGLKRRMTIVDGIEIWMNESVIQKILLKELQNLMKIKSKKVKVIK